MKMRSEVFTLVKIQVVFWVVTPYSVIVKHQCFKGSCCLHLQEVDFVIYILLLQF